VSPIEKCVLARKNKVNIKNGNSWRVSFSFSMREGLDLNYLIFVFMISFLVICKKSELDMFLEILLKNWSFFIDTSWIIVGLKLAWLLRWSQASVTPAHDSISFQFFDLCRSGFCLRTTVMVQSRHSNISYAFCSSYVSLTVSWWLCWATRIIVKIVLGSKVWMGMLVLNWWWLWWVIGY
jgi:hypothetical protein